MGDLKEEQRQMRERVARRAKPKPSLRNLSAKQRGALQGISDGKNIMEAALEAGYTQASAERGLTGVFGKQRAEQLRAKMRTIFTPDDLAFRIKRGADAQETRLFSKGSSRMRWITPEGVLNERVEHDLPERITVEDERTRQRWVEFWARLSGIMDSPDNLPAKTELEQIRKLYEVGPVKKND